MGVLSWLRHKYDIFVFNNKFSMPVRKIIQNKIILAGNLMSSQDKKEAERGKKILRKVGEAQDLYEELWKRYGKNTLPQHRELMYTKINELNKI